MNTNAKMTVLQTNHLNYKDQIILKFIQKTNNRKTQEGEIKNNERTNSTKQTGKYNLNPQ